MKAIEQYIPVVLFVMLYVVLSFASEDSKQKLRSKAHLWCRLLHCVMWCAAQNSSSDEIH